MLEGTSVKAYLTTVKSSKTKLTQTQHDGVGVLSVSVKVSTIVANIDGFTILKLFGAS